jgi:hypothetical protein
MVAMSKGGITYMAAQSFSRPGGMAPALELLTPHKLGLLSDPMRSLRDGRCSGLLLAYSPLVSSPRSRPRT